MSLFNILFRKLRRIEFKTVAEGSLCFKMEVSFVAFALLCANHRLGNISRLFKKIFK